MHCKQWLCMVWTWVSDCAVKMTLLCSVLLWSASIFISSHLKKKNMVFKTLNLNQKRVRLQPLTDAIRDALCTQCIIFVQSSHICWCVFAWIYMRLRKNKSLATSRGSVRIADFYVLIMTWIHNICYVSQLAFHEHCPKLAKHLSHKIHLNPSLMTITPGSDKVVCQSYMLLSINFMLFCQSDMQLLSPT